jgi:superoxide reductase
MKGIVCGNCGFVSLDGIPERCPACGGPKEKFSEKEYAYKTPDFKAETGESEKKHIPQLKVSTTSANLQRVVARVGEIEHPMMPEHFITQIYFYLDNKYIGSSKLTPSVKPEAAIYLSPETKGKISVIENCNIHGKWLNEINL